MAGSRTGRECRTGLIMVWSCIPRPRAAVQARCLGEGMKAGGILLVLVLLILILIVLPITKDLFEHEHEQEHETPPTTGKLPKDSRPSQTWKCVEMPVI